MLRSGGEPVLSDFGVAAMIEGVIGERRLTPPNVLMGTADYLAPEVISGGDVDARADVYALGIVLYEMLTGLVPFAGRDSIQMLRAHCEEDIPPLPLEVPQALRSVVERALRREPRARFATAAELSEALAALV
jgi:serine/threonine protein kinase